MSDIDPQLSAKWRAASDEQPPAALDDAIRAAARREVGAKPGGFRATPRWLPLAVAATVAAVAVGIVQMTPPEQVTPATFPAATDAARRDVKPETGKPMESGQKPDMVAAAPPQAPRDMLREEAKPVTKEQRSRATDEKTPVAGGRVGGFAAPPDTALQEKKAVPQAPAQRTEKEGEREQALKQKPELATASSVARQNSYAASPSAASAVRNDVQPFPAAPVPAETALANAPKSMADSAPPPAPSAAPASPVAIAPAPPVAARKLAAQSSATGAATGGITSNSAGGNASKDAGNAESERARDATALGKTAAAEADKPAPERRKDSAPPSPDEWIKRIRRLIAEGRNEDAAKELAAFRREYKERSDVLLPSDLRAFRQ